MQEIENRDKKKVASLTLNILKIILNVNNLNTADKTDWHPLMTNILRKVEIEGNFLNSEKDSFILAAKGRVNGAKVNAFP